MRYSTPVPAIPIRPPRGFRGRDAAKHRAITKAVKELVALRKTDPKRYQELIKKDTGRPVRIVPG